MSEIPEDLNRYPLQAQALDDLTTRFPKRSTTRAWKLGEVRERRLKDRAGQPRRIQGAVHVAQIPGRAAQGPGTIALASDQELVEDAFDDRGLGEILRQRHGPFDGQRRRLFPAWLCSIRRTRSRSI